MDILGEEKGNDMNGVSVVGEMQSFPPYMCVKSLLSFLMY